MCIIFCNRSNLLDTKNYNNYNKPSLNEKYLRSSFKICTELCFLEKEMEKYGFQRWKKIQFEWFRYEIFIFTIWEKKKYV